MHIPAQERARISLSILHQSQFIFDNALQLSSQQCCEKHDQDRRADVVHAASPSARNLFLFVGLLTSTCSGSRRYHGGRRLTRFARPVATSWGVGVGAGLFCASSVVDVRLWSPTTWASEKSAPGLLLATSVLVIGCTSPLRAIEACSLFVQSVT